MTTGVAFGSDLLWGSAALAAGTAALFLTRRRRPS
ncbi:MAG: LPXTG cell wall anchor domain-containing protein [Firmicutes bacterium]|nr:LPXTG cell wall anchor domain-containing protein [Bacillota bacterium]